MSFADALRREFMERIQHWVSRERREIVRDCGNDLELAVAAVGALEGGRVISRDLDGPDGHGGRLWFIVGDQSILGCAWWFNAAGHLEALEWWGHDPYPTQRNPPRQNSAGGRHPITGEVLN